MRRRVITDYTKNVFFFNDTATTEIYTLSLHDALPIWRSWNHEQRAEPKTERNGEQALCPYVPEGAMRMNDE